MRFQRGGRGQFLMARRALEVLGALVLDENRLVIIRPIGSAIPAAHTHSHKRTPHSTVHGQYTEKTRTQTTEKSQEIGTATTTEQPQNSQKYSQTQTKTHTPQTGSTRGVFCEIGDSYTASASGDP